MSLETRHMEKNILFNVLRLQKEKGTLDDVESLLLAQMEQDDVQVVRQRVDEWFKNKVGRQTS